MSWTHENYFTKASIYWSKGTNKERGSNEHILAVSICLELVVRGILCKFNPTLNAAQDEESIFYSVGVKTVKSPRSIDMNTAFNRLTRLIPDVSEQEQGAVRALIDLRNRELHSDEAAFDPKVVDAIFPNILSFFVRVCNATRSDLTQLLTPSDAEQARRTFEAVSKDRSRRVNELIKIQKDRFFGRPKEEQVRLRKEHTPDFSSAIMKSGHHVTARKCPACGSLGILGGTPVGSSDTLLDSNGIFREVRVIPTIFSCKVCNLEIKELDELISAKMPHEFVSRDHIDAVEHFDIDVMDYVDTEEIARQYNYQHDYMDE